MNEWASEWMRERDRASVRRRGLNSGVWLFCARFRVWEETGGKQRLRLRLQVQAVGLIDAFVMESRTANLVLRLLQRHLPVPWPAAKHAQGHGHLPGLLPRVPLSFHAPRAGKTPLLGSAVARHQDSLSGVERTSFGVFFRQPNSPFLAFDRASDAARVQAPAKVKVAGAGGSDGEEVDSVWGFKLGLRLKSGMYMPTQHEEEGWEASSVKRKRKKKMNKHKQRKLRRRDRHRN